MKLNVNNIPDSGLVIQLKDSKQWCVEACRIGSAGSLKDLDGELHFLPRAHCVEVTGRVSAKLNCDCHRCGAPTRVEIEVGVSLRYYPQATEFEQEIELTRDDLGVGWYENGALFPGDVLCEIVSLNLPNRVLCLEVQRCEQRMVGLMAESQVDRLTGHPAFAALKGFGRGPTG